jgi:aspartate oxidase
LRYGIKKWSKSLSQLTTTINDCSYVLALLDGHKEQRILSVAEANFRKVLNKHQSKLLEAKMIYWRKRANIRWAKLGDENTIFFSHGSYQELQIQLYQ